MFDLSPQTAQMKQLVLGVRDDQLDLPTPCSDWTVAGLLAHIHQFASVFTTNARKQQPSPPAELDENWRQAIPTQLDDLAQAWQDDAAWTGQVSAGGVDMDAADNALVGSEELTLHGWDLARATGQQIAIDDAQLDRLDTFIAMFAPDGQPDNGPYGPTVAVGDGADRTERTLARTGRDPQWSVTN